MSTTVDNRVVQMTFDHKEFEEGISKSLKSLQELENRLDSKEFAKDFDISGIIKPLEYLQTVFDPIAGAGIRAFTRLADAAVNQGARMLKALSIDNVSAGWQKFAEKTTSVGTLIAQGYDMETVNEQLERLNWFTDETSYNFTEMVNSIGKFTATGKGLEESVTAMEGIANWAALSGQNAATASRAMYQISQAMGAGYFRLEDYKSIQNASMDTDEFRQKAIDAAIALGTLRKEANDTYRVVATGDVFTKSSFTTALTEGKWFTSDVMLKVFNEYGTAVNQLYDYSQKEGTTASEAIEALGDSVDSFGLKAFKAAQEARTFSDVIDSVKDAASTSFMNTFELIIGNYEQATKVYTTMANTLYDVFAEPINQLNEFLDESLSGDGGKRLELLQTLANIGKSLISIWDLVKESMSDVFEFNNFVPITVEQFQNIIDKLKNITERLILQDDYLREKLEKTLVGVFSVIDIGFNLVKRFGKYLGKVFDFFKPAIDITLSFTAGIGDFFRILDNSINTIGFYRTFISEGWRPLAYARIALDNVRISLEKTFANNPRALEFYENMKIAFGQLESLVGPAIDFLQDKVIAFSDYSKNAFTEFLSTHLDIQPGKPVNLSKVTEKLREMLSVAREFVGTKIDALINTIISGDGIDLQPFIDAVKHVKFIENAVQTIRNSIDTIRQKFEDIKNFKMPSLKKVADAMLAGFFWINIGIEAVGLTILHIMTIAARLAGVKAIISIFGLVGVIIDSFTSLTDALKGLRMKMVSEGLLYFAGAVAIMAGVFFLMSKINWHKDGIIQAGLAIAALSGLMWMLLSTLKYIDGEAVEGAAKMFLSFAGSIAILAIVFDRFTKFFKEHNTKEDLEAMANAGAFIIEIGLFLSGISILISKVAPELSKNAIGFVFIAFAIDMLTKTFRKLYDWYAEAEGFSWDSAIEIAAAFGVIMLSFAGAVGIMEKASGGFWKGVGTAIAAVHIANAIGNVITALSKYKPDQMKQLSGIAWASAAAFTAIGASMVMLAHLEKEKVDVKQVGKTLKGVIASMTLISVAYWIMGQVSPGKIIGTTALYIAALVGIYKLMDVTSKLNRADLVSATESFGIIATSLVALGLIIAYMSKLDLAGVSVAAGALGITTTAIVFAMEKMIKATQHVAFQDLLNAVKMFAIFSLLLLEQAAAFSIMSLIDWKKAWPSIVAFGVTTLALAVAFDKAASVTAYMSSTGSINKMKDAIKGYALFGLTLLEIAGAFYVMGKVNWTHAPAMIGAMAASLTTITGAIILLSKFGGSNMIKAGTAAVLMGVALNEIALAFTIMDKIQNGPEGAERLRNSLIALVGVMAIMSVAAYALSSVADKIAIVAVVFVVIAGAMVLVGGAAYLAGKGFEVFANGVAKLVENENYKKFPDVLKELATGIIQNAPLVSGAFFMVIYESLKTLRAGWNEIKENVFFFIKEFFKMKIAAFGLGIEALLEYLAANTYKFVSMGMIILYEFLRGIEENIEFVTAEAVLVAIKFMNGLAENAEAFIEAGANLIEKVMEGVANKLNDAEYQEKMANHMIDFFKSIFVGGAAWHRALSKRAIGVGTMLGEGVKKGVTDYGPNLAKTAVVFGSNWVTSLYEVLGIASPSKKTYAAAIWLVKGLTKGIKDNVDIGKDTAKFLADSTLNSFDDAMKAGLFQSLKGQSGAINDYAKKLEAAGVTTLGGALAFKAKEELTKKSKELGLTKDGILETLGFGELNGKNLTDFISGKMNVDDTINDMLGANTFDVDSYMKDFDKLSASYDTTTESVVKMDDAYSDFNKSMNDDNPMRDKMLEIADASDQAAASIGALGTAVAKKDVMDSAQMSYHNMLGGYTSFRRNNDDLTSAQKRYSKEFFDDLRDKLYDKAKSDIQLNRYLNTMSQNDWEQIFLKYYNYAKKNGNTEKSADMFSDTILDRLVESAEKFAESGESVESALRPVIEAGKYSNGTISQNGEIADARTLKEMAFAYSEMRKEQQMNYTSKFDELISMQNVLRETVEQVGTFIRDTGIVLDSGQLVGALTPGVNSALGTAALLAKRG